MSRARGERLLGFISSKSPALVGEAGAAFTVRPGASALCWDLKGGPVSEVGLLLQRRRGALLPVLPAASPEGRGDGPVRTSPSPFRRLPQHAVRQRRPVQLQTRRDGREVRPVPAGLRVPLRGRVLEERAVSAGDHRWHGDSWRPSLQSSPSCCKKPVLAENTPCKGRGGLFRGSTPTALS